MMSPERAVEIIENLVDGIHPLTGEILPESNICEETSIVDALNCAIQVLNERIVAERAIEEYRRQQSNAMAKKPEKSRQGKPDNAGKPWLPEDDKKLLKGNCSVHPRINVKFQKEFTKSCRIINHSKRS